MYWSVFQYCNIAVLQTNIAILVLSIALLLQYFFKSSIGVLQYCKKIKSCNTQYFWKISTSQTQLMLNVNAKVLNDNEKCLEKYMERKKMNCINFFVIFSFNFSIKVAWKFQFSLKNLDYCNIAIFFKNWTVLQYCNTFSDAKILQYCNTDFDYWLKDCIC